MSHQQARPEDIRLVPLGSSSSPQSTPNRAAKSTLDRFNSETSPRRASSFQPRGKQASTTSGRRQTPAQPGIGSSNPSVLKMGREVSPGPNIGDVRDQFSDIDKRTQAFSQTMSDLIVQSNTLPSPAAQSSPLPGNSPVGKPAHEFPSLGDYIYFALVSIINTHMCEVIFEPFHPAASPPQKNARYTEEYSAMIASQKELGLWRSQKFSSIDSQVGPDRVATLILGWARTIHDELAQALESSTGPVSVPESFVSELRPILETAYAWNSMVKREFLAYDLKPFVVKPSERWDPERMRLFEPLRGRVVRRDSGVVSSVALGLYRSVSQGLEGRRALSVEQKARVLVEEWFMGAGEQCNIPAQCKGAISSPGHAAEEPAQVPSESDSDDRPPSSWLCRLCRSCLGRR